MPFQGKALEFKNSKGEVAGRVGPTYLYPKEAAQAILAAGFSRSEGLTCLAVMREESLLSPDAEGDLTLQDETWGPSVGVMQIRSRKVELGKGTDRDATVLKDVARNLTVARRVHAEAGFRPWGAWSSGRYRKHLPWAEEAFSTLPATETKEKEKPVALRYDRPSGYTSAIPPGTNALRYALAEHFGFTRTEVIRDRSRCQQQSSEHCVCRAVDLFTTDPVKGRAVFDFLVANAAALGIQSVIFRDREWGFGNWTERQRDKRDHFDHVHTGLTIEASKTLTKEKVLALLQGQEEYVPTKKEWDALVKDVSDIKTGLFSKSAAKAKEATGRGDSVVNIAVDARNHAKVAAEQEKTDESTPAA